MIFIAEFCQNHNGDFEVLKDMVYEAYENGADYAKIQTIFADMLSYRSKFENGKIINNKIEIIKRPYDDEYKRLKSLEISYEKQSEFVDICKKVGVKPLTTAFTRDSVSKIKDIGFKNIKIASYDCSSIPLLKDVKDLFENIFVSTGATFNTEIEEAAAILKGSNFSFMHCVTIYPTPLEEFHLNRMKFLRNFSNKVGWSDHSNIKKDDLNGTKAAIYFGADIIERHFTILPTDKTKDGPVSISPQQLFDLKKFSLLSKNEQKLWLNENYPDYKTTLGSPNRRLSHEELLNRDYYKGRFTNKINGKTYFNWE